MENDVFRGHGVEVTLPDPQAFLKVKETLSRIGIASKKEKTLYQSAHIFHKQGRYAIVSFKEMFLIDGKKTDLTEEDIGRRNTIAALLDEWGLCDVVDPSKIDSPRVPVSQIKILSFKDKKDWNVEVKYTLGKTYY